MNNIPPQAEKPQRSPVRKNSSDKTCESIVPRPTENRISTDKLLNGARELIIEHTGEEYRLRITSRGKLILTK